eukprot:980196-Rhodomonas_salina.1
MLCLQCDSQAGTVVQRRACNATRTGSASETFCSTVTVLDYLHTALSSYQQILYCWCPAGSSRSLSHVFRNQLRPSVTVTVMPGPFQAFPQSSDSDSDDVAFYVPVTVPVHWLHQICSIS